VPESVQQGPTEAVDSLADSFAAWRTDNGQSANGQSANGQSANGQSANGQSANGQDRPPLPRYGPPTSGQGGNGR
jgi:hypothetical protein